MISSYPSHNPAMTPNSSSNVCSSTCKAQAKLNWCCRLEIIWLCTPCPLWALSTVSESRLSLSGRSILPLIDSWSIQNQFIQRRTSIWPLDDSRVNPACIRCTWSLIAIQFAFENGRPPSIAEHPISLMLPFLSVSPNWTAQEQHSLD